ncbi:SgcJ/EcaC family oxidoreductase [Singulisphaera rosea]
MRMALSLVVIALITNVPGSAHADQPRPAGDAGGTASQKDAENAIRATDDAYLRAYNSGNVETIAGLFTEDAEVVAHDGQTIRGRKGIAELFTSIFEEGPGNKLEIKVDSLRFLGPDVAIESGESTLSPAKGGQPDLGRFTAILVKQDGHWLQSYVREDPDPTISHHDRLKELEWMVGEWVEESRFAVIFTKCRWSEDKNYLLREFTIQVDGKPQMTGNQRIGWDAAHDQFRSWRFDSDGGFGEGAWTRSDKDWVVKSTGTSPDGRRETSTLILTAVDKNTARCKLVDRTIGGESLPDIDEMTLVKRPPQPK